MHTQYSHSGVCAYYAAAWVLIRAALGGTIVHSLARIIHNI